MEKKIGKSAKLLMISDLFYSLTSVFSGTFLVAYFLNITSESIATVSIYYILVFSLLIARKNNKKHKSNRKPYAYTELLSDNVQEIFKRENSRRLINN